MVLPVAPPQIVNILLSPFFGCLFGLASFSIVTLSWFTGALSSVLRRILQTERIFCLHQPGLDDREYFFRSTPLFLNAPDYWERIRTIPIIVLFWYPLGQSVGADLLWLLVVWCQRISEAARLKWLFGYPSLFQTAPSDLYFVDVFCFSKNREGIESKGQTNKE